MFKVKYLIGKEYVTGRFLSEESEFVAEAFKTISAINRQLFDSIPVKVNFTEKDPYITSKEMRQAVIDTGEINIYTGWSGHPFLTFEQNNISRAVHDVFAHLVCGCPFTFEGEYTSYLEQRKYYPEWTWKVLFAEIPAQTCAYYYKGGFSYNQRAIEAPDKWLTWCRNMERDYSKNSVLEAIV
jgi:hypothetical protein